MPRDEKGHFVKAEAPPPPERVELLTVEAHPILGRIERWRMSDGTVQRFEVKA